MRKMILSGLLAASVVLAASCSKDLTSQEHLAKADEYMAAGEYAAAQIELKNAALKDPQSATARVELARLALLMGDWAAAEKEARRAIDLGVSGEVYRQLATALFQQESYQQLVEETDEQPEISNGTLLADVLGYRALALIRLYQYRDAEAVVEAALELDPESPLALLAKSAYEHQVGRRDTAMALAVAVTEKHPELELAWIQVGELHQLGGDLENALEAYNRAVETRSFVTLASARRAFIAARLGDIDAAKADINRLKGSAYRGHPDVTFAAGYLAFIQGKYDEAALYFEQSLAAGKVNPVAMIYMASAFLNTGKFEQARVVTNQLYQMIPTSVDVNRMMASIEIQQQDFEAARARIEGLKDSGENDEIALGMLGSMALMEGDGDAAVGYFEKLVALSPADPAARKLLQRAMSMRGDFVSDMSSMAAQEITTDEYGQALMSAASAYGQGQVKEALTIAENLQQQFPDEIGPLKMLAAIYLASNDAVTGRAYFEQVLVLEPEEPTATKGLAQIFLANGEEQRALDMMTAYMKNHPADEAGAGILANAIILAQDYTEAERSLTQLLEGVNENVQARAYLARLYFDNRKYEQVLFVTENLSPELVLAQPSLMEMRGKSLVAVGRPAEAGRLWQRWLEIFPDSVLANYYHGLFVSGAGQLKEGLEYLEKSHTLNPDYLPARLAIVRVYAALGDMERASEEMARLQSELKLPRAEVWYVDGWLKVQKGEYAGAEKSLRKSLELEPTPDTVVLLVVTLNTLGRGNEGLVIMEQGLKSFPNNETMLKMQARTYLESGDTDRAITLYKRVLALRPGSVVALNNLAWLLQDSNIGQAVEYAQLALEASPDDPQVLDTIQTLRQKGGQF